MYQHLIFSNTDGVVRISLNRPEVYHALSLNLIDEITAAVQTAENDSSVRVVVLTAEGDKAFCSGADLKAAGLSGKSAGQMLRESYNPMIQAIRNIPKPVVCRVNGLAVGAGCSLALACDYTIATEDSYFSQMFVQIGLMPDAGASFVLPRLVGMARAFDLASTGRKVSAREAVEIGLINKAVTRENLDVVTEEIVSYYRHAPTMAIAAIKRVFNQSFQSDLSTMLALEVESQDNLYKTEDAAEGISSFLKKKKPDYQGK